MKKDQVLSTARHVLTFVGGLLVAQGKIDEPSWIEFSGALMALVGWIWGQVDKRRNPVF